jgi:hypothetical protein
MKVVAEIAKTNKERQRAELVGGSARIRSFSVQPVEWK